MGVRSPTFPRTRAGLPNATHPSGMSRATTAPAPIRHPAPMRTYGRIVALTPTWVPAPIEGPAITAADVDHASAPDVRLRPQHQFSWFGPRGGITDQRAHIGPQPRAHGNVRQRGTPSPRAPH